MSSLRFTKMHGLGNDYVYVDLFDQTLPGEPEQLAPRVADRHTGVGSDGLILIEPPTRPDADVRMRMYNVDGSRSRMCGNGIRCVGKYAYERGRARKNPLRVETDSGVLTLALQLDAGGRVAAVRVDMGTPSLAPESIPLSERELGAIMRTGKAGSVVGAPGAERPGRSPAATPGAAVELPLKVEGVDLRVTCVSMGNPHAVAFVNDVAGIPLGEWGPAIEYHPLFPDRVNVHFAQVLGPAHLKMRTWERGSGPTRACGTGASAVCVAAAVTGRAGRRVDVDLPGGRLEIEWDEVSGHVFMTGPATHVFDGVIELGE